MAHNPAFQFYPGDWFREPGLQRVDLDVRGAWAELLMMMHHETPRGVSTGSISGLARQLRITIPRACFIVEQLASNHIAEVEYFDDESKRFIEDQADEYSGHVPEMSPECPEVSRECPYFVTLKNRRMVNEEKDREYERLKKQKQRSPDKVPGHVPKMSPPLSPSPSPSPTAVQIQLHCEADASPEGLVLTGGNGHDRNSPEGVLKWLNEKSGKNFRPVPTNLDFIRARLKDGILPEQLKAIVSRKVKLWKGTDQDYCLRPATLFNKTKCEQYLGELPTPGGFHAQDSVPDL